MPTYPTGRNATGISGQTQLLVRIGRGIAARTVTVPLPADAQLVWSAPGGDDTATMTIPWADRGIARPDAFAVNMPVRVEDRRTGEILWQGRIADSGFTGDRSGQEFHLAAVGSGRDLDHIGTIKNYMDRDLSRLTDLHTYKNADISSGDGTGFVASAFDALGIAPDAYIELPIPEGATLHQNIDMRASYVIGLYTAHDMGAEDTGFTSTGIGAVVPEVHGIRFSYMLAHTSIGNTVELLAGSAVSGSTITIYTSTWDVTTQVDVSGRQGSSASWTRTDIKYGTIRWQRTGASTTETGQDGWLRVANLQVVGKRYDRYGNDWTASNGVEALHPYAIFEDILGTVLAARVDPGVITTDTVLIDQASWWKATPVTEILNAAAEWNSSAWWGVWAPANPDSLPRLDYRSWGTVPRYVLDDYAEVQLGGGGETWANSALVTYLRGNSVPSTLRTSISVPVLTRVFGTTTRDAEIDLTDRGPLSKASAITLAQAALADLTLDKVSGSAKVSGPLLDDLTGKIAQPWELRPGWPVLVGQLPEQYAATGTAPVYDDEASFRLTKVTYSAGDNSANLELDGGERKLWKAPGTTPKFRFIPQAARRVPHR